ncbi:unnamed protein product [Miscanthus lutarioriparius]|uniref:Fe2OG dioxygenase domain-containing protein n=1 Tax=Miscanthus lutarioriparius TaxID=422564 RepID=A0A811S980_9POAL|nr:unnamed protein product [Miscanthus lutarioriparius]
MADESWRVPSLVQELAATVQEPPSRYLIPEQDRRDGQLAGAEMPEPVPTIDLRRLFASDGADQEATKLRAALQSWGFFLVTEHGIESSLLDSLSTASREFFRKPLEEKQAYSNLIEGKHWQLEGYGNEQVYTQDQILDWGLLHEYSQSCKRVKDGILRAVARLLDLDDDDGIIGQFGDRGSTNARFNYYPACPRPDLVLGVSPHNDACVLTLLLADEHVGGLQFHRDGTWYCVPPVRGRPLLVNVGVSLEIMSNGVFKSPVHRVVTNSQKERMSLAMFYATDLEKEVQPIAELLDEKHPARYKKIKYRDLMAAHYEHFSRRERVIESLNI